MIKKDIKKILSDILKLKKINATKDLPLLASLAMAVPILIGLLSNNLKLGMTASLAAIMVVYFPLEGSFSERILMLIGCSFGFISVYTIGLIFSFNRIISVIVFGITAGIIHWTVSHFKLKLPKDFFFVMLCSTAISIPHQPIHKIAENIGYLTFGTLLTCMVVFLYCFIVKKKSNLEKTLNIPHTPQEIRKSIIEAIIFGIFLSMALGVGYFLNLTNPYWVAVSLYCCNARKFGSAYFPKKCSKNNWNFNRSRFLLGNTFICKKSMGNMCFNNNPSIHCRIFSAKKLWNSNDFYNSYDNFFI